MRIDRLGESAAILREFEGEAANLAHALEGAGLPGLHEAVACYDTVGIYFDPQFDVGSIINWVAQDRKPTVSKEHAIPVCYELGEDLDRVCMYLDLTAEQVIEAHTGCEYKCFAIGFCPGFPYLGYLSDQLAGVPRRSEPRLRIEPGSVAITGRQTGIYPLHRPGGWALIGKTPLEIVDVEQRYFPICPGDKVRFYAVTQAEFDARRGERL